MSLRGRPHLVVSPLCGSVAARPCGEVEPVLPCFPHRLWNKETFDHLLGYLSSPEAKEMGLFLISGYNLFTRPVPVRDCLVTRLCLVTLHLELGVFWLPQGDICPKDGLAEPRCPQQRSGCPGTGLGSGDIPPQTLFSLLWWHCRLVGVP